MVISIQRRNYTFFWRQFYRFVEIVTTLLIALKSTVLNTWQYFLFGRVSLNRRRHPFFTLDDTNNYVLGRYFRENRVLLIVV
jgi:hypothetical protein